MGLGLLNPRPWKPQFYFLNFGMLVGISYNIYETGRVKECLSNQHFVSRAAHLPHSVCQDIKCLGLSFPGKAESEESLYGNKLTS